MNQKIAEPESHSKLTCKYNSKKYSERALLVCNNKTGQYLNYRQLIREPKHKEIWSTSAANKFGRLAQGVGGRVKGTNTIIFICKEDQEPKDRIKDVTYGSYGCEIKKKRKKNIARNSLTGETESTILMMLAHQLPT
jgi:hypothetical protein